MPFAWDAARVTFQVSYDNIIFRDLYDMYGAEYSMPVSASRAFIAAPADFAGFRYVKVRSGLSGSVTDVSASRVVQFVTRVF
jgi:hypothetical protein